LIKLIELIELIELSKLAGTMRLSGVFHLTRWECSGVFKKVEIKKLLFCKLLNLNYFCYHKTSIIKIIMKRSIINSYIKEAKTFFNKYNFNLPPWAYFTPDDWKKKGDEYQEIRKNMLGWDITDFGKDNFEKEGLLLFTLRNGNFDDPMDKKTYAEKIMVVREKQVTPIHFHWNKMEDIINRNGGDLLIQLWKADDQEKLSDQPFTVQTDGVKRHCTGGDIIRLKPGESICLESYIYHQFWAENDIALVGEVSMVNDDNNDNRFYAPLGRFPAIEEDESPLHLLCNEYPC